MECQHAAGSGSKSVIHHFVCRSQWAASHRCSGERPRRAQSELWVHTIFPKRSYVELSGPSSSVSTVCRQGNPGARCLYLVARDRLWLKLNGSSVATGGL